MSGAETVELKPCPFCGGDWVYTHRPVNGAQPHIGCKSCNARGPFTAGMSEEQWVAAWNTRATQADALAVMREAVEALEPALDFVLRYSTRWDGVTCEHPSDTSVRARTTLANLRAAIARAGGAE